MLRDPETDRAPRPSGYGRRTLRGVHQQGRNDKPRVSLTALSGLPLLSLAFARRRRFVRAVSEAGPKVAFPTTLPRPHRCHRFRVAVPARTEVLTGVAFPLWSHRCSRRSPAHLPFCIGAGTEVPSPAAPVRSLPGLPRSALRKLSCPQRECKAGRSVYFAPQAFFSRPPRAPHVTFRPPVPYSYVHVISDHA